MTDFSTWSRENLEQFAKDCSEELKQVQQDLRVAIDAYRELIRTTAQKETRQEPGQGECMK